MDTLTEDVTEEATELVSCASCSDQHDADDLSTTDDGEMCVSCREDYFSCEDCNSTPHIDRMNSVRDGDHMVCDSCLGRDYFQCEGCEGWHHLYDRNGLVDGGYVCEGCTDYHYYYCEDCDGYYHEYDSGDHEHGDECDCESPHGARSFTIRNDGESPLANDTRATVTLPAGIISSEGMSTIARYLREQAYGLDDMELRNKLYDLSYRVDEVGTTWQTREGNFTKRLSRFAYKNFGLKLTPDMVSRVGCIGSDHSTAVDFALETTRNLNLSAEEFGHEDSCWWQSYYESRCTLKSNGGFGLRTFKNGWVNGRAWVMPLRADLNGGLTPTFDTVTPDAFIVFNGYGDLSGYAPARIMAHMAGMTYRKVAFHCSPMYVNNESGYLVAPEELASKYTDGTLDIRTTPHSNLFEAERASAAAAA